MIQLNKSHIFDFIQKVENIEECQKILAMKFNEENNIDFLICKLINDFNKAKKFLSEEQILKNITVNTINSNFKLPEVFSDANWVDKNIGSYVKSNLKKQVIYQINNICNFKVTVIFGVFNNEESFNRLYYILIWLYMIKDTINSICKGDITIHIYPTPFKKELPKYPGEIISSKQLNSGATYFKGNNRDIYVWRKEEWFKVFIHETMHGFNLDFGFDDKVKINKIIKKRFPINKDINLFETFTEVWAKIINNLFVTMIISNGKQEVETFIFLMNVERLFTIIQTIKILEYMNLTYLNFCDTSRNGRLLRLHRYKESSNFFEYFLLGSVVMFDYYNFMAWCYRNKKFIKYTGNPQSFLKYVLEKSNQKKFINIITKIQESYHNINLSESTRFTICEVI